MTDSLARLDRIAGAAMRWFCILCFLALMGILSGVVLIRFWPIAKLSWSDEIIELLMAWIVFIGAAALWREKAHFRIEAVLTIVGRLRHGWILGVAVELASAIFIVLFTYYSFDLTVSAHRVSPILSLPRPIWYAAMPAGGIIMVVYSLAYSAQTVRRIYKHQPRADRAPRPFAVATPPPENGKTKPPPRERRACDFTPIGTIERRQAR